jgi:hypothetical protein
LSHENTLVLALQAEVPMLEKEEYRHAYENQGQGLSEPLAMPSRLKASDERAQAHLLTQS